MTETVIFTIGMKCSYFLSSTSACHCLYFQRDKKLYSIFNCIILALLDEKQNYIYLQVWGLPWRLAEGLFWIHRIFSIQSVRRSFLLLAIFLAKIMIGDTRLIFIMISNS